MKWKFHVETIQDASIRIPEGERQTVMPEISQQRFMHRYDVMMSKFHSMAWNVFTMNRNLNRFIFSDGMDDGITFSRVRCGETHFKMHYSSGMDRLQL